MNYSYEQMQILENRSNYQQVIAAAGSGKTSTMIGLLKKIIEKGEEKEEEILVITFSKKAAQEIKERLDKVSNQKTNVMVKTFHAYCYYILKKYHPSYKGMETSIIEPKEKEEFFKSYFQKEKFKIGGIPYELIWEGKNEYFNKHFSGFLDELQKEYENYKRKNKKLDFDDLIKLYLECLEEKDSWTLEAQKEVKRIIVDEFQDTDMDQLKWLKLLKPEKLTVVGDDWQAIYGFRGASTIPFLKFQEYFSPCNVQFLTINFRSLPEIVNLSALPISKNKKNIFKKVTSNRLGKAKIFKLKTSKQEWYYEFQKVFDEYIRFFPNTFLLCRSNYRIAFFLKIGIPTENVMTIHASKGLEFHTVFVDLAAGWNNPDKNDKDTLEEERRILYVALSRAKDNLILIGNQNINRRKLEDEFFSYFHFKVREIKLNKMFKLMR